MLFSGAWLFMEFERKNRLRLNWLTNVLGIQFYNDGIQFYSKGIQRNPREIQITILCEKCRVFNNEMITPRPNSTYLDLTRHLPRRYLDLT